MKIMDSILRYLGIRTEEQITTIVIHHTVMPRNKDILDVQAAEPFAAVGYNAYVKWLGGDEWILQQGRPLKTIPAAQYGLNVEGYAIAFGGNYQPGAMSWTDTWSPGMFQAALPQIRAVQAKCPNLKYLIGHRDVERIYIQRGVAQPQAAADYGTACPGDNLYAMLDTLRTLTGLKQYPGLE